MKMSNESPMKRKSSVNNISNNPINKLNRLPFSPVFEERNNKIGFKNPFKIKVNENLPMLK